VTLIVADKAVIVTGVASGTEIKSRAGDGAFWEDGRNSRTDHRTTGAAEGFFIRGACRTPVNVRDELRLG
jgi:hypothetical protein